MFIELRQWGKQGTNTHTLITSVCSSTLFLTLFGISTSFKKDLNFVGFFFCLVDLTDFYVKKKFLRNTWYAMELFYSHVEYLSWSLVQGYVVLKPHSYFFHGIDAQTSEENTHREALWLPWLHCQTVCGKVINYNFFEFVLSVKTIFLNRYLYKC